MRSRLRMVCSLGLLAALACAPFAFVSGQEKGGKEATAEAGVVSFEVEERLKDKISFKATVNPPDASPGETVTLTLTVIPAAGHYTYPISLLTTDQKNAGNKITFKPSTAFQPLWPGKEAPKPKLAYIEELEEHQYKYEVEHTWTQKILILPGAEKGIKDLNFTFKYQVCDASNCVPSSVDFTAHIGVKEGGSRSLSPALKKQIEVKQPEPTYVDPTKVDGPGPTGGRKEEGLWAFVLQGIFWGAVSLVTPCVFPMIPITVSFFLKKAEDKDHRPLLTATIYSATIVIVLTFAAVALLSVFRYLSTHWLMNLGLGLLFIFFALSLFGMYEIQLPGSLARFTSSREGQGVGGTIFMALTFTIISFACVAPFLGGFTGTAGAGTSGMPWYYLVFGGLGFSVTFAAPFFFLALFPSMLKKMPQSGGWLNTVKVVMGFLELAAALKFFRTAEILAASEVSFLTYDFVLGLYIAISVICGLYLLGFFRLSHDGPVETISAPRMLLGVLFVCLGLYLTPGLFKSGEKDKRLRPEGVVFAWLDAFLLPEDESELEWERNLDEALVAAPASPSKRVFIDFTGQSCTNCKLNEHQVFPKKEIQHELSQYSRVQLYTDVVPLKLYDDPEGVTQSAQEAEGKRNLKFQREVFGTEQLPLYVIAEPSPEGTHVAPDGKTRFKIIAVYDEGKINKVNAFLKFLKRNKKSSTGVANAPTGR